MRKRRLRLDRISNLPRNVTDNILAHLPIRDVVRTSTLSKNWKEKWMTVPHIVFDSGSFGRYRSDEMGSIINYILCRHKGKIQKLRFSVDVVNSSYDIKTLIYKLSPSCIQDLSLEILRGMHCELPPYLFSYQLTHLKLRNFLFKPPPSFKGFRSLKSLDLDSIEVEANELKRFIRSCPVLEQLTLTNLSTTISLDINARSLKYCVLTGEFRDICLNTPLLFMLSINMKNVVKKGDGFMQRFKILDFPPAIEKLSVKSQLWRFSTLGDIVERRPTVFNHLMTLEIDKLCFKDVDELKCLISLIESSPNLHSLSVSGCTEKHSDFRTILQFLEAQIYSNCYFVQLRRVRISSFLGESPELEFIRYVLYNSPLLEEMTIEPINDSRYDEKTVTRQVMRFMRASPSAEIIYLETTGHLYSSPRADDSDSYGSNSSESDVLPRFLRFFHSDSSISNSSESDVLPRFLHSDSSVSDSSDSYTSNIEKFDTDESDGSK